MLPQIIGQILRPSKAKVKPSLNSFNAVDASTFGSFTLGAGGVLGDSNVKKIAVLYIGWKAAAVRSISSVTIGGITATVVQSITTASGGVGAAIVYVELPFNATTAAISINFSGTVTLCSVFAQTVNGLLSPIPKSSFAAQANAASVSGSIDIFSGGFTMCSAAFITSAPSSLVLSGMPLGSTPSVLETTFIDTSCTNFGLATSSAFEVENAVLSAEAGRLITGTVTGGSSPQGAIVGASWR